MIFGKPDCGKVTPSELANDDVPTVRKCIANLDWMITAFAVIFPVFFVLSHNGSGRSKNRETLYPMIRGLSAKNDQDKTAQETIDKKVAPLVNDARCGAHVPSSVILL